jgi:hypothetical protein
VAGFGGVGVEQNKSSQHFGEEDGEEGEYEAVEDCCQKAEEEKTFFVRSIGEQP